MNLNTSHVLCSLSTLFMKLHELLMYLSQTFLCNQPKWLTYKATSTGPQKLPTGLSINNIWYFKLHRHSLKLRSPSSSTTKGPFSTNRPNSDDPPGPPCSHKRRGASGAGPYTHTHYEIPTFGIINLTGKNQKYMLLLLDSLTVKNPAKLGTSSKEVLLSSCAENKHIE